MSSDKAGLPDCTVSNQKPSWPAKLDINSWYNMEKLQQTQVPSTVIINNTSYFVACTALLRNFYTCALSLHQKSPFSYSCINHCFNFPLWKAIWYDEQLPAMLNKLLPACIMICSSWANTFYYYYFHIALVWGLQQQQFPFLLLFLEVVKKPIAESVLFKNARKDLPLQHASHWSRHAPLSLQWTEDVT